MADFAEDKLDLLRELRPFKHGAPSHDTFGRVLSALDPEQSKDIERLPLNLASSTFEQRSGRLRGTPAFERRSKVSFSLENASDAGRTRDEINPHLQRDIQKSAGTPILRLST